MKKYRRIRDSDNDGKPQTNAVPEEKLQELYTCLTNGQIDIPEVETIVKENDGILDKIYKNYRGKNILQIACSNFAENISKEENLPVLNKLISGNNLFYSNKSESYKEVIHYAALSGHVNILQMIIEGIKSHDEGRQKINASTSDGETALVLLLKKRNPGVRFFGCIRTLIEAGIDVDASDINNSTAILLACKKVEIYTQINFIDIEESLATIEEIIQLLLNKNCDIDSHKLNNKTARMYLQAHKKRLDKIDFEAIAKSEQDVAVNIFGLLKEGMEYRFIRHPNLKEYINYSDGTLTLLQLACRKGLEKSVQSLLRMGAKVDARTEKNGLPVEIAAKEGFPDVLSMLLEISRIVPHSLLLEISKNLHRVPDQKVNHGKCLDILLKNRLARMRVNYADETGATALHCAARLGNPRATLSLLKAGGRLSVKDDKGNMPIQYIDVSTLEKYFDHCIYYKNTKVYNNPWLTEQERSTDKVIEMDYSNFLPEHESCASQTELLRIISDTSELNPVLKHPLVSSFLYLKWYTTRWFHYLNITIYALYCILLYTHIFLTYLNQGGNFAATFIPLGLLSVSLVSREIMQCLSRPTTYIRDFENYIELILFLITFVVILDLPADSSSRKQLAAFAIILSSHELVLSLGQLPEFSTNVVMFKTVSWNFIKFIFWYVTLLIGYALSFFILFNKDIGSNDGSSEDPSGDLDFFQSFSLSIVKTVVMLTGEFDAASMQFQLYPFTSVLIFLAFIFTISMVVFNLLNGLAISDIQEIRQESEIVANRSRLEYMLLVESVCEKFLLSNSKRLQSFVFSRIYANSNFFKKGIVQVSRDGCVVEQKSDRTQPDADKAEEILYKSDTFWKSVFNLDVDVRLDEVTFSKIKYLLEVTKIEEKYSNEWQILENQKQLERRMREMQNDQKLVMGHLHKMDGAIQSLHSLLEEHAKTRSDKTSDRNENVVQFSSDMNS